MGALRQADCGVALLTGFGAANTEDGDEEAEVEAAQAAARAKVKAGKKKETPLEAAHRKREEQQRVRAAFQKSLAAEMERRKIEEGAPKSVGGWLRLVR